MASIRPVSMGSDDGWSLVEPVGVGSSVQDTEEEAMLTALLGGDDEKGGPARGSDFVQEWVLAVSAFSLLMAFKFVKELLTIVHAIDACLSQRTFKNFRFFSWLMVLVAH